MADYNNPLEVQLKLTADATQITKTLEELKKQGIKIPAKISEENIEKAFKSIQEQAKANNIKLDLDESNLKNKITMITDTAKQRFEELGTHLRKVFNADSINELQDKVNILKEIQALQKVTKFIPGVDSSFTAPDGKVLKTTQQYKDALYDSIEALNKIKSANSGKAAGADTEKTRLGLENLYNTSKKVLPVLANEFISLSKDSSASADTMIEKFKEVYSKTEKYRLSQRKYQKELYKTEKKKKYLEIYTKSESFKENQKKYCQSEKGKDRSSNIRGMLSKTSEGRKSIPLELIELKRIQMKLKRKIKEIENGSK